MKNETLEDLKTKQYYIFDMDGTFADTPTGAEYHLAEPDENMIKLINCLYDNGCIIFIETGRGATLEEDFKLMTQKQLQKWGVKYHKLCFIKKPRKYLRVDDAACTPEELINRFLDGDIVE